MALIQKLGFFGGPLLIMAAGALVTQGCDEAGVPGDGGIVPDAEEICGPCGKVDEGSVDISGSAQFDGFFRAVGNLNANVELASKGFVHGLANLEAAFGLDVDANADLQTRVDDLVAEIEGEITANASGELMIDYQPAQCTANVDVAIEASADCKVEAGCDVSAECTGPEVDVQCEGKCEGSCEGGCEGDFSCEVDFSAGGTCEGSCKGSCELEAAATCEGTCRGQCEGTCSATVTNADGEAECAGSCDGECTGTCEVKAGATCEGSCHGTCDVEVTAEADCEGSVKCEASCSGSCSGGCSGTATPPSCEADAECEAAADCEASASAEASADIQCTPPSVEITFAFDASLDASARASFNAKMEALKANIGVMLSSTTRYEALFEAQGGADMSAAAAVQAELESVVSAVGDGSALADIPIGRLPCLINELGASVTIVGNIIDTASADLEAQAAFAASFATGFGTQG